MNSAHIAKLRLILIITIDRYKCEPGDRRVTPKRYRAMTRALLS